jgi:hypothetical protein
MKTIAVYVRSVSILVGCSAAVSLPTELLKAGPDGKGIAYLDLCRLCGLKLSSHWDSVLGTVDER